MEGSSHALVGGVVGGLVSLGVGNDLVSTGTMTLTVAGVFGGLIPDLDTNGKMCNKITLSHQFIKNVMMLIGVVLMVFSFIKGTGVEKFVGLIIGLGFVFISKHITQRKMLMVTGLGVVLMGVNLSLLWVILLGVYILVASNIGHRTYTHSVIGLIYFGYIAYLMGMDLQIKGLFLAMVLGYVSHLVCDFKLFNKKGVKLFRPFIDVEF